MQTEWAIFGTVALAHLLGVASPGPDFAMIVRQSLAYGRAAGVWTAAGIGSGILFHVAYGLFGLAWLTRQYPASLTLIGVAGAAFLVWMGAQALRAQPQPENCERLPPAQPGDWKRFYGIGVLTNVLNPKATLFFVALFTAVVTGPTGTAMKLVLGLWLPLTTFAWFAFVALMLSNEALRRKLRHWAHWIDRAMGAVLLLLGAAMLGSLLG
ncbi:MAG: LysE family transporter [Gammaproteobacteria bacterium]|nr:LysE family transporter [Gammaproteobacteria bacterium]